MPPWRSPVSAATSQLRDHGSRHPGGVGQITARQAAVKGGIPMGVPALTVNKVCLTGLNATALADQRSGPGLIATADSRMLRRPNRRLRS
jgi:Thiolase, N-terminal domain